MMNEFESLKDQIWREVTDNISVNDPNDKIFNQTFVPIFDSLWNRGYNDIWGNIHIDFVQDNSRDE